MEKSSNHLTEELKMLSLDFTKELIGLKDIIVKNVVRLNRITEIEVELERKEQLCPCCGIYLLLKAQQISVVSLIAGLPVCNIESLL